MSDETKTNDKANRPRPASGAARCYVAPGDAKEGHVRLVIEGTFRASALQGIELELEEMSRARGQITVGSVAEVLMARHNPKDGYLCVRADAAEQQGGDEAT